MSDRYPKLSEKIHSERNWLRCKADWVAHAVELEQENERLRQAAGYGATVKIYPPAPIVAPEWDAARELADQDARASMTEAEKRQHAAEEKEDATHRSARQHVREPDEATWDDAPLSEDAAISAAHPTRTGRHDLWGTAMRLVGAKRSKGAFVALAKLVAGAD